MIQIKMKPFLYPTLKLDKMRILILRKMFVCPSKLLVKNLFYIAYYDLYQIYTLEFLTILRIHYLYLPFIVPYTIHFNTISN